MATMIGDESIEKVGDFWGGAGQPEGKTSAVGVELNDPAWRCPPRYRSRAI
jgi:hypothetical protein